MVKVQGDQAPAVVAKGSEGIYYGYTAGKNTQQSVQKTGHVPDTQYAANGSSAASKLDGAYGMAISYIELKDTSKPKDYVLNSDEVNAYMGGSYFGDKFMGALDINQNSKIESGEYAAYVLYEDANKDGVVTGKEQNNANFNIIMDSDAAGSDIGNIYSSQKIAQYEQGKSAGDIAAKMSAAMKDPNPAPVNKPPALSLPNIQKALNSKKETLREAQIAFQALQKSPPFWGAVRIERDALTQQITDLKTDIAKLEKTQQAATPKPDAKEPNKAIVIPPTFKVFS